jgi:uncharacterized membrane protein YoaK (UPF0700 family)
MHPLRLYAYAAVAFALIATVISAQFHGFLNAVMDVYALAFVPLILGILTAVMRTCHQSSVFTLGSFWSGLLLP